MAALEEGASASTNDGWVVVMGGVDPASTQTILGRSSGLFLTADGTQSWQAFDDMNTPRTGLTAVALNDGSVLAIAGSVGTDPTTGLILVSSRTPA